SKPSREMVLRLGEHLEVPLRERNRLLLAAGYAPAYTECALGDPGMTAVRQAVRQLLSSHEPHPAAVVDRAWNLVDANASTAIFLAGVAPELLVPPVNVLRATLHPDGMAPRIRNLGEWRGHLIGRLRRQVTQTADSGLAELLAELQDYPCDQPVPEVELPGPGDIFVPLRFHHDGNDLTFFSTVATLGTPLDVTVAEVADAIAASGVARDELFVTTKVSAETVLKGFEGHSDMCLLSGPGKESAAALTRLHADGRFRAIGVAGFGVAELRRLIETTGTVPAVNQVELHPWRQQVPLREF